MVTRSKCHASDSVLRVELTAYTSMSKHDKQDYNGSIELYYTIHNINTKYSVSLNTSNTTKIHRITIKARRLLFQTGPNLY